MAGFIGASRQALCAAAAIAGIASVAAAQATFKLTIFTSAGGYLGTAQVTSTATGIDCRSESSGNLPNAGTCNAEFPAGSTVTLTATPLYGGTFDGWVGACAGQGATCEIAMTQALTTSPKTIAKTYTLTVRGHETANAHGGIANNDFWARPRLTCAIGPGGVTSGVCETQVPANQMVWLRREEAALGYVRFMGYTGCGTDPFDCRIVMDGPRVVTAGWVAMEVIVGAGPGSGTGKVTGVADGYPAVAFDCTITPQGASGACSVIWEKSTPPNYVTLTATPTGNSVFVGWSGKCSGTGACIIPTEINPLRVYASFEIPTYSVSVAAAGTGSGTVVSVPEGINCVLAAGGTSQDCAHAFPKETAVTLTADPTGGSTFGGWSGACSGVASSCVVTTGTDGQATARFIAPRPAAELAFALLGELSLAPAEQRELDRFGNKDGTFNLGDLLALLSRTGERLSTATMTAVLGAQPGDVTRRGNVRNP